MSNEKRKVSPPVGCTIPSCGGKCGAPYNGPAKSLGSGDRKSLIAETESRYASELAGMANKLRAVMERLR